MAKELGNDNLDLIAFLVIRVPLGIAMFPAILSEGSHNSDLPELALANTIGTGLIDAGVIGGSIVNGEPAEVTAMKALAVIGGTGIAALLTAMCIDGSDILDLQHDQRPMWPINIAFKRFIRFNIESAPLA